MIYLAIPYTDPDPAVREERFQIANKVAGKLMNLGHKVFSPISHCHPIALVTDLPTNYEYWREYNQYMIERCTSLYIIRAEGWRQSVGVQLEIRYAESLRMPIMKIFHPFGERYKGDELRKNFEKHQTGEKP